MKKISIAIVGAGWYGCHLALYLKKIGHKIIIFEKNKDIFLGASGFNQFRLHVGFHYPRSSSTINEIKNNFDKFKKEYKKYIKFPKKNIYCIAKNKSLIDLETYKNILKAKKLKFKSVNLKYLDNIEGAINVKEGILLNTKVIKLYKKKLKKELKLNKKINSLIKISKKYDLVIDCTNNTLKNNFKNNVNYLLTISHIFKTKKNSNAHAVTIMDGKLPSIYPYSDKPNFFSLTHSSFTHIKKFGNFKRLENFKHKISKEFIKINKDNMIKGISIYYKNFGEKFLYKGHFFSYKVMPNEKSDKRPTFIKKYNNIVSIFSGKIANIYSAQDYIQKLINKK